MGFGFGLDDDGFDVELGAVAGGQDRRFHLVPHVDDHRVDGFGQDLPQGLHVEDVHHHRTGNGVFVSVDPFPVFVHDEGINLEFQKLIQHALSEMT